MAKQDTKDTQHVAPVVERWYSTVEAAAMLGVTHKQLQDWRVQRRGPRFKKFGKSIQSPVAYAASALAEWQSQQLEIETEQFDETQKAS